ncbi:MAG TPA: TIGR03668 family PPOX class F420-dependent oxidoreductase [Candidatus Limnocylindrales bacterium]|nr:TIGR03668 family PPOX class F420-dependent oxidoreductase [Candidatus Limnocylindrales bacterium]
MQREPGISSDERHFLARARTAVLATIAPDGAPRLVPICFTVASPDVDGRLVIHTPLDEKPKRVADPRDLERVRDIATIPTVGLLVDRWSEDWSQLGWLRLAGRAELIEPDGPAAAEHASAVEALRAKYPQYATHRLGERPMIRIVVEHARSWGNLG